MWLGYTGAEENKRYQSFPENYPALGVIPYPKQSVLCKGHVTDVLLNMDWHIKEMELQVWRFSPETKYYDKLI